ncbi:coiled-coil domain-containing protein R3HCC1L [Brevipalpus obovatus]|uniref:coiled-coil domain-containing protein R3HCC1L n=1 Tax=Brevipalpus obovatus TaxID=246614 RepID=UPI003D9F4349
MDSPIAVKSDHHQLNENESSQCDVSRYSHVLEIYDFSPELKTQDIITSLSVYNSRDFDIKWVNATHALAIFSSRTAAQGALSMPYYNLKLRCIKDAIEASKLKCHESSECLPYKKRPQTSSMLARRLVTGALGIKSKISPEQMAEEKKKLDEAREKRRTTMKSNQDIWEGNVH